MVCREEKLRVREAREKEKEEGRDGRRERERGLENAVSIQEFGLPIRRIMIGNGKLLPTVVV